MSRECPVTTLHCHNTACVGQCLLEDPFGKRKQSFKEMMDTPWQYFSHDKDRTIDNLAKAVERLTRENETPDCKDHEPARFLGVELIAATLINSVSFNVKNKSKHMSVSFKAAGGATATLKGFDKSGNVTANGIDLTKPITAVSNHPEFFTATVSADPASPLQVTLKGVADGAGTITYSATSIDGTPLTLVDDVTVSDVPPPTPATSLGVDYVVF